MLVKDRTIFDVPFCVCRFKEGVGIIEEIIKRRRPSLIVLANVHTLNIAYEDMSYKQILRNARVIFRDGAGVEWALKKRGIPGLHNFCGTDFIPDFCKFTASKKYRYYLLGSNPDVCRVAAEKLDALAPGIIVSGYHHGYFPHEQTTEIVDRINKSRSDVLLVAREIRNRNSGFGTIWTG